MDVFRTQLHSVQCCPRGLQTVLRQCSFEIHNLCTLLIWNNRTVEAAIQTTFITGAKASLERNSGTIMKPGHLTIGRMWYVWSNESSFALSLTIAKQVHDPDLLSAIVQFTGGSVVLWAVVLWYSAGLLAHITARHVPTIVSIFLSHTGIFHDDNALPHGQENHQTSSVASRIAKS